MNAFFIKLFLHFQACQNSLRVTDKTDSTLDAVEEIKASSHEGQAWEASSKPQKLCSDVWDPFKAKGNLRDTLTATLAAAPQGRRL